MVLQEGYVVSSECQDSGSRRGANDHACSRTGNWQQGVVLLSALKLGYLSFVFICNPEVLTRKAVRVEY